MRLNKLALPIAALVLAGCGDKSTNGGGGDANGGTVIIAMPADAQTLFPLLVNDETAAAVTSVMFGKLAKIGEDQSTVGDAGFTPWLADRWEWGSDSLSLRFHLNPAARFHDGTPVRASDVRYTFNIAKDPTLGSPFTSLLQNIDSVQVVDSLTPVFWYKRRSAEQFYDAVYQIAPVPEHIYGKVPVAELKTSDVIRNPVGSGRFRFVKWEPGVRLEMIADTANFRGRPKLDRVIWMMGQAPATTPPALLSQQIDFFSAYPIDQADKLDSGGPVKRMFYRQNGYGYIGLNQFDRKSSRPHPILADINVRKAISMALDRPAMIQNVFKDGGLPAYGPFPTGAALSDTTLGTPAYDTTAAKAALDAAGWRAGPTGARQKDGRPLKVEIMTPASSLIRVRFAELIQEQLRRVGIEAEVAKVQSTEFTPRMFTGDFDLVLQTVATDPSISGIIQFWGREGFPPNGLNILKYSSPVVQANLDSASRAASTAAVKRYISQAFRKIIQDVPAVWLYSAGTVAAVNSRIDVPGFPRDGWWNRLDEWSIPPDKRIDRDRIGLRAQQP